MRNDALTRNAVVPLILRLALAVIFIFHGWHKVADRGNEWGTLWAVQRDRQRLLVPAAVQARLGQWEEAHPAQKGADPLHEQVKSAYAQLATPAVLAKNPDPRALHLSAAAQGLVAWGEFLGGIALLIGLLTRVAAAGLIIIQAGAIALVTGAHGFSAAEGAGYEYNIALIGMCLVLILIGGGPWSVHGLVRRRRRAVAAPPAAPAPVPVATA